MQLQPSFDEQSPDETRGSANMTLSSLLEATSQDSFWIQSPDTDLDLRGPLDRPFDRTGELFSETPAIEHLKIIAEKYADRIAMSDATSDVTYADFLGLALRLAHMIAAVTTEGEAIGSLLPNSAWQPVAMLACMAIGRPLVPLNARDPGGRLAGIASTARIALLIGQGERHTAGWVEDSGLHWINIEAVNEIPSASSPLPAVSVDAPALVLYTSGSTGQPKGVVNSQRALLHRVHQSVDAGHFNASDVVMPFSGLTTIAGCREMLSAVLTGARLHIVDVESLGLRGLLREVRAQHVTISYIVPALLRALVTASEPGDFNSLRLIRVGGEKVLRSDITLITKALRPDCLVQVSYSSTETTGSQWFIPRNWDDSSVTVPVGYLLPGIRFAVVDEQGLAVPAGEVGELVICSRYVLLGYWTEGCLSPTLPDPDDPLSRIFSTGDLVTVDARGLMRVIGRKGRQLKINGRRVEPAELETALHGISYVKDAVTIVTDANELVVFASPNEAARATFTADVRDVVRQTLPSSLHPTRLHEIAEIPRGAGGKIDSVRLKELDLESRINSAAPRIPALKKMAEASEIVQHVWSDILGTTDATGRWDDAGGDSLKLLRCIMDLESVTGRALNMAAFTVDMTATDMIHVLATNVRPTLANEDGDLLPQLIMLPGSMGYGPSLAAFGAQLSKVARVIPIRYPDLTATLSGSGTVDDMATAALEQIKAAQPHGDIRLIGYSLGGGVAFEIATRLITEGRTVKFLGILDTNIGPRRQNYHETLARTLQRIGSHRVTLHRMLCRAASKWVARFGWQVPFCRLLDNGILSRLTDTRFILKLELEEVLRMQAFDRWRLADKSRLPITGTIFACNRRSAQIGLGWVTLFEHTDIVPIVGGHLDFVVEPHVTVNLPVVQRAVAASYA